MSRYFSGAGKLYIGAYPAPSNFTFVGNCPMFTFSPHSLDLIRMMPDANSQASDLLPQDSSDVQFSATLEELSAANMQILLAANNTTTNAASGQTQTFTSKKGCTFPLGVGLGFVYKVTSGGGSVTYVNGTDYVANPTSISVPSGSSIVDTTVCTVTYDQIQTQTLDPFQQSWAYRSLFMDGINSGESWKPWALTIFKMKIRHISTINLLSDVVESVTLTGILLPDPNTSNKYYSMIQSE